MPAPIEKREVLVTVRTYPTPAHNGVEVSCTAGVTREGGWIRLFSVPYRFLQRNKQFQKYQWVEVSVIKANDGRPESYKLVKDSIRVISDQIGTDHEWRERKALLFPLKAHCLCCLVKERDAHGYPTLGLFRPRTIERLVIAKDLPGWTPAQQQILAQQDLFEHAPKTELEKIPFKFKYRFHCDHDECSGHALMCTDWEMGQSWRSWRDKYGEQWRDKFLMKYETQMKERDTHFYVGTVHRHPHKWIIVGLFYPLHEKPAPAGTLPLFST